MPVIVLTTILPPPPPPTGFGGTLKFPFGVDDLSVAGSLRTTEDDPVPTPVTALNVATSGSLRSPDDVQIEPPTEASDLSTAGSLRAFDDTSQPLNNGGSNVTGSPNFGDV